MAVHVTITPPAQRRAAARRPWAWGIASLVCGGLAIALVAASVALWQMAGHGAPGISGDTNPGGVVLFFVLFVLALALVAAVVPLTLAGSAMAMAGARRGLGRRFAVLGLALNLLALLAAGLAYGCGLCT